MALHLVHGEHGVLEVEELRRGVPVQLDGDDRVHGRHDDQNEYGIDHLQRTRVSRDLNIRVCSDCKGLETNLLLLLSEPYKLVIAV